MAKEAHRSLPDIQLPSWEGDPVDQLGSLDDLLDRAAKDGIINQVPDSATQTYDIDVQRIRLQTISERLYLLGYLEREIPHKRLADHLNELRVAVKHFQQEAGLEQDEWVGNKTWYALEELVSFETEFDLNFWFDAEAIRSNRTRAMQRAVQLRLWSLGLYKHLPARVFDTPEAAVFSDFNTMLQVFLIPVDFELGFNQATISLLYDQDGLTQAVAARAADSGLSFQLHTQNSPSKVRLAKKIIVNIAKIELWLLGYKVKIDGKDDFDTYSSDLHDAMVLFYKDFKQLSDDQAHDLASSIKPTLFMEIAEASEVTDDADDADASEWIAGQLNTSAAIEEAWQYARERGSRLWDGLKRVWRWIKKMGKEVIHFVKDNLFKGFFRFASKAYKMVSKGIGAVVDAIDAYIKGALNSDKVMFRFSKDMDTQVFLKPDMQSADGEKAIDLLTHQTKAFSVGCRMIAYLFKIIKSAITGLAGWARLLYCLVKSYQELRILYIDFKSLER